MEEVFPTAPQPELVGNAFVEQYYNYLHQSPNLVPRFYNDSSVLSRPEPDGSVTKVTTMQGIEEMIFSLDYTDYEAEILTADSQASYMNGVLVLVTGCLTGKDNVRRKFTQSFFLAPQEKGYFVLNDVFRYVDEHESVKVTSVTVNDVAECVPTAPLTADPEPTHDSDKPSLNHTTSPSPSEKDVDNDKEISLPLENVMVSVAEKEVVAYPPVNSSQNDVPSVADKASSNIQEDAPKKSFASVVNALKTNTAPFHVRVSHAKSTEQYHSSAGTEALAPSRNSSMERNNDHGVKDHSIFIANLPMNATAEQLEGIFKKFGHIKRDGIQVRSHKNKGSCYGFVQFESSSSVQSALEASPITIGDRKAPIEGKRQDNNDTVGFQSGRGGFRNENFRSRGSFGRGRGYGRNEFEKQGEFSGRTRGAAGRNGEDHQRGYPNGATR